MKEAAFYCVNPEREPVIRLMVEGASLALVEEAVRDLSFIVEHHAGTPCL